MDRLGAGRADRVEYLVGEQIAFGGGGRSDMNGFVGHADGKRARIGIRIHRNGGNTHLAGSSNDSTGNFAAVGDEYFGKHGRNLRKHVAVRNLTLRTGTTNPSDK